MTRLRFSGGTVLAGGDVLASADIVIADGRVAAIAPVGDDPADQAVDLAGGWLMPGFVDTQVNGGGGVLFNDDTTVEGIRAIGAAHARYGTTAFLPTLISTRPDHVARAMAASDRAVAEGVEGAIGIHVEGPVLNPARKGIHDAGVFQPLDDELFDILTRPHRGTVMVTLAPERVAPERIRALVAAGVRVSAGHSEASHDEALAAFDAGMTGITHLFNAMPALRQRAPGLVGAALDDPRPWCGLIVDGVHVDPAVLRIAMRARPVERMMLVTDAMCSVGAAEKNFMLGGRSIHVEGGMCMDAEGTLAGSDLDMAGAVERTVRLLGRTPAEAAAMAAAHPAAFVGHDRERGRIAAGFRADFAWLDAGFRPQATWIGGRAVWSRRPLSEDMRVGA